MNIDAISDVLVAQGAVLLDTVEGVPSHWRSLIDLDDLSMSSSTSCILGFIFADNPKHIDGFYYALEHTALNIFMGGDSRNRTAYGFASGYLFSQYTYISNDNLYYAWHRYLCNSSSSFLQRELTMRRDQVAREVREDQAKIDLMNASLDNSRSLLDEFDKVLACYDTDVQLTSDSENSSAL